MSDFDDRWLDAHSRPDQTFRQVEDRKLLEQYHRFLEGKQLFIGNRQAFATVAIVGPTLTIAALITEFLKSRELR